MRDSDTHTFSTRKISTMKWKIPLLVHLEFIMLSHQSIAGITYHDNFDFEERYRDVRECDPFYWHPLHLPEQCAEMFENLIRSRVAIAARSPVRVVKKRQQYLPIKDDIFSLRHYYRYLEPEYGFPIDETEYIYGQHYFEQSEQEQARYMSPYEKMLEFLTRDVRKHPTAPVVGMSNYGPIAVYKQPVSKKSKDLMTIMARAYANTGRESNKDDDGYYYGKIEVSPGSVNPYKTKNNNDNEPNNNSIKDENQNGKAEIIYSARGSKKKQNKDRTKTKKNKLNGKAKKKDKKLKEKHGLTIQ